AGPTNIIQRSPFLRIELAGASDVVAELVAAGIDARARGDETSLLWEKLVFLAPVALATTAMDAPLGAVRVDARFRGCMNEAFAVARAVGAVVDEDAATAHIQNAPAEMRSSMQKDVEAGRAPELDAIAGPIVRGASTHGIAVPDTEALARLVAARAASRRPVARGTFLNPRAADGAVPSTCVVSVSRFVCRLGRQMIW